MLKLKINNELLECGVDEAGRGCLAGPVTAAACILPNDFISPSINDSKQLTPKQRETIREVIESSAIAWAIAHVWEKEIDRMNILNASIEAMHRAINLLAIKPQFIAVDGNRFKPLGEIPHKCIIKGDAKFQHISAASILAKTERDRYMSEIHQKHPEYQWHKNKGYPTSYHRKAIMSHGITIHHRKSFRLLPNQLILPI